MHCPKCGQLQVSEDTRYCSRCGFLLTAVAEIIENSGLPVQTKSDSLKAGWRQNRSFKRGLLIFLLTFLIVPILTILTIAARGEPYVVVIAAILFGLGGILKMAWALLFESEKNYEKSVEIKFMPKNQKIEALPEMRETPANAYASPVGAWRDTNDLEPHGSITDPTTKFLVKEADDQ